MKKSSTKSNLTENIHMEICSKYDLQEEKIYALVDLINEAYSRHSWLFPVNRTSYQDFCAELSSFDFVIMLSLAEKGVLGTALMKLNQDSLYFSNAAIALNYQGLGLGDKLLKEIEDFAHERNLRKIKLITVSEIGNVEYYKLKNYRVVSEELRPKGEWGSLNSFHLAQMEKEL